jgi:hypothetical protein
LCTHSNPLDMVQPSLRIALWKIWKKLRGMSSGSPPCGKQPCGSSPSLGEEPEAPAPAKRACREQVDAVGVRTRAWHASSASKLDDAAIQQQDLDLLQLQQVDSQQAGCTVFVCKRGRAAPKPMDTTHMGTCASGSQDTAATTRGSSRAAQVQLLSTRLCSCKHAPAHPDTILSSLLLRAEASCRPLEPS